MIDPDYADFLKFPSGEIRGWNRNRCVNRSEQRICCDHGFRTHAACGLSFVRVGNTRFGKWFSRPGLELELPIVYTGDVRLHVQQDTPTKAVKVPPLLCYVIYRPTADCAMKPAASLDEPLRRRQTMGGSK